MNKKDSFSRAVGEILIPEQHRLQPGVAVAISFCVWNAVRQDGKPAARITIRWQDSDLDLPSRLHRDLYLRTVELMSAPRH